jgi:hypothetical protein
MLHIHRRMYCGTHTSQVQSITKRHGILIAIVYYPKLCLEAVVAGARPVSAPSPVVLFAEVLQKCLSPALGLELAVCLHLLSLLHRNPEALAPEVVTVPQHAHDTAEVFLLV